MRCVGNLGSKLVLAIGAVALSACGGNLISSPRNASEVANSRHHVSGINKIQHVVIVIQENRSVDNLFQGFPGADTRSYGYDSSGQKVKLGQIPLETTWDLDHSSTAFFQSCNGTGSYPGTDCQMNGFNNEYVGCGNGSYPPCPIEHPQYAYVPPAETRLYFEMGEQYVLADHMFASNFDESSFVAHQYLIAAQSNAAVNFPNTTEWGCEGGPYDTIQTLTQQRKIDWGHREQVCFDYETLGDELDAAGLSWRYYTAATPHGDGSFWSAYSAVSQIYNGPDWTEDVISPQTVFFTDVQNGNLADVTWITPTEANSDHAGSGSNTGPDWVASIVNAIGDSQYWDSTAIFVTWDDPGGWYDHVAPEMLDYDGLGFRVPLLVISPYAKQGYVSHLHYELASILRFVEDRFGLSQMSASDARAKSPAPNCFNFNQAPRAFQYIDAKRSKDYFMHQPPDLRPVDTE
jgi:phospholipase C